MGEPASLSASVSDHTADFEGYGAVLGIDTWRLNGVKPGDPAMDAVMDALRGGSCRASLRNLLNHTVFYPAGCSMGGSADGYIDVHFSSGQGGRATVSVWSDGQVCLSFQEDGSGYYAFHGDGGLFEALAGVIREYGTQAEPDLTFGELGDQTGAGNLSPSRRESFSTAGVADRQQRMGNLTSGGNR